MKVPTRKPRMTGLLERTIRILDPLGIRLPGRIYHQVLQWHYLSGLRLGMEERAPRQTDCITP
jgi:hypothetical protein